MPIPTEYVCPLFNNQFIHSLMRCGVDGKYGQIKILCTDSKERRSITLVRGVSCFITETERKDETGWAVVMREEKGKKVRGMINHPTQTPDRIDLSNAG